MTEIMGRPMARVLCEWGMRGVETLRGRAAVLVVVDVLSFCTAVDVATARGAQVFPFPLGDPAAANAAAARVGAVLARPRRAVGGQYSLSPASLALAPDRMRLMLPSPNGARLSLGGAGVPVIAGCLRNARAAARLARKVAAGGVIGIVPAGERWPDGSRRPAIEDLLGAGAIASAVGMDLDLDGDAESRLAATAFRAAAPELANLVRGSVSGRELADAGFAGDVDMALRLDASSSAAILRDDRFVRAPSDPENG